LPGRRDHGATLRLYKVTDADARVHLLGPQVQIRGEVIASWRTG